MEGVVAGLHELRRLEQVSEVLIKHELGFILDKLHLRKTGGKEKELQPQTLVKVCEELGGTFIKFGQFLSLRPDLIPHEYSAAFEEFQDDVPPFPSKAAKELIAKHLGTNLSDVFSHVQDQPIAAASIGQVHKAKLKSGQTVAVKVMRPGIKELFMTDLLLIYRLASLIEHHFKPDVFDPLRIAEEFRHYTQAELNYLGEAAALKTVAENFKAIKRVAIPKVYEKYTTEGLLVMDYLPGPTLRKAMPTLPKKRRTQLAAEITHITLKMIFIDGYFHADLHPGNILLTTSERLGLIDLGIMGVLDEHTREYLTMLFLALIDKDIDGVVKVMGRLGFFTNTDDETAVKQDLALTLAPYYGVAIQKMDLAELFLASLHVAREHHLKVPAHLVLLGKAIITLKGVVEELDPSFDLLAVAKPFMSELLQREVSLKNIVHKAARDALQLKSFITELPQMTADYFEATKRFEGDLQRIGYQIEVFSRDVTLMLRQGIYAFLFLATGVFTFLAWNHEPLILGISAFSIIAALVTIVLFTTFLRTFRRIVV